MHPDLPARAKKEQKVHGNVGSKPARLCLSVFGKNCAFTESLGQRAHPKLLWNSCAEFLKESQLERRSWDKIITSGAVKQNRSPGSSRLTGQSLPLLPFVLAPRVSLQCSVFFHSSFFFLPEKRRRPSSSRPCWAKKSAWMCQGPGRCWGRECPVPTKPWQTGRSFPAGIPIPWAADPFWGLAQARAQGVKLLEQE